MLYLSIFVISVNSLCYFEFVIRYCIFLYSVYVSLFHPLSLGCISIYLFCFFQLILFVILNLSFVIFYSFNSLFIYIFIHWLIYLSFHQLFYLFTNFTYLCMYFSIPLFTTINHSDILDKVNTEILSFISYAYIYLAFKIILIILLISTCKYMSCQ